MALRVLLADESSTIKKVFQLSLQDYAVDVATVTVGPDVPSVAKKFKPDIIFCDVLLQKKNGYDVCAEIKADPSLKQIPVVLMWSSFLELDEDKLQASLADSRLEKPFDVKDLRSLVNQYVPKTQGQRLSSFLNFPTMPEMVEPEAKKGWTMESFDPIPDADEAFEEVALPPPPKTELEDLEGEEDTNWSAQKLNSFTVEPTDEIVDEVELNLPDEGVDVELEAAPSAKIDEVEEGDLSSAPLQALNSEQIEKIVREQSRALIEEAVWKIVPDLAQQIIERELKRLLDDPQ